MVSVLTSDFTAFAGGNNNAFTSDTTSGGIGGVVVLSSTDCSSSSSSSSACSGHSDITEPGSPYSSPASEEAVRSPEEFPEHSEESEDSPSPPAMGLPLDDSSLPTEEEPRPPDPCWPPYQQQKPCPPPPTSTCRTTKKRPYPFNTCNTTSTPKRFRPNSGNSGTPINVNHNNNLSTNTTSLIPYQPVTLNNHQKQSFQQKLDPKINNNVEIPKQQQQTQQQQLQQQKWTLPKVNLANEGIKGQGKITEYFKTQIKATPASQKSNVSLLAKKGQLKNGVKKEGVNKFFRIYAESSPTAKEVCVQPALLSEKESRGSKILTLLLDSESMKSKASLPSETTEQSSQHSEDSSTDCVKQSGATECVSDSSQGKPEKKRARRLSLQAEVKSTKNGMRNDLIISSQPSTLLDLDNKSNNVLSLLSSVEVSLPSKALLEKDIRVVNRLSLEVKIPDVLSSSIEALQPKRLCLSPRAELLTEKTVVRTLSAGLCVEGKFLVPAVSTNVIDNTSCKEVASLQAENNNKTESVVAAPLSPILSAPRVIRFPVAQRSQAGGLDTEESVRCCWTNCEHDLRCGSKLLEHLQSQHVNPQLCNEQQFVCLWVGCKVYGRTSCSLSWLERHVLSHGGSKPFRCIVDGCGLRFSSQGSLERHVNGHFNNPSASISGNGTTSNGTRRSTDAANNKLFRRNGKKLRLRRQPWSARMFDYIDTGMMEGVQHRLLSFTQQQMQNVSNVQDEQKLSAGNHVALRSKVLARRVEMDGTPKVLVRWMPEDILPDEWMREKDVQETQVVPLSQLSPSASATLHHSLLPPHSKAIRKPRKPLSKPRASSASATSTS